MKKAQTKAGIEKRDKIKIMALIILLLMAISITVYAYFTGRKTVTNSINLGYNDIEVKENYVPPLNITKGISFTKEPYVNNVGNVDCYVRIKSVVSDSRVKEDLDIDYNEEDYVYNEKDGYWYYKNIVKPGESTKPLFTTVKIADNADDIVLDGFEIYVYAESVQVVEGKTMNEVWDYFKQQP